MKTMLLAETEVAAAIRDVRTFNESLEREGMRLVKHSVCMPNDVAVAYKICKALGYRMHIVETMRFDQSGNIINGMAINGVAFVSYPTLHEHVLWTIGHEMWHAGEQVDIALFEPSLIKILGDCHPGLVNHRRNFEADKTVSDRHVQSEVLADFNGEMWIDPMFWRDLAGFSKNGDVVELFEKMQKILESEKPSGRFGVQYYNKDKADLRKELVAVWAHRLAFCV
ncbi:hypothetical protein [Duganella qianjiadongensis]|uniref:Uncharacterized protein n=1 Tax=Duganella qianjiadongensis TaxID=2692176 RepID=A0ABW9VJF7_9BURK|nr:hypothetical protein [Duganella qianjiadongensis]MYM39447.1 hypothetical protein [Duganella qianjiadongensis]